MEYYTADFVLGIRHQLKVYKRLVTPYELWGGGLRRLEKLTLSAKIFKLPSNIHKLEIDDLYRYQEIVLPYPVVSIEVIVVAIDTEGVLTGTQVPMVLLLLDTDHIAGYPPGHIMVIYGIPHPKDAPHWGVQHPYGFLLTKTLEYDDDDCVVTPALDRKIFPIDGMDPETPEYDETLRKNQMEATLDVKDTLFEIIERFLYVMNQQNVIIKRQPISQKDHRKRIRKKVPYLEYKVLKVDIDNVQYELDGDSFAPKRPRRGPRRHEVRSHMRTLHRGTPWERRVPVQAHKRGTGNIILKDYELVLKRPI